MDNLLNDIHNIIGNSIDIKNSNDKRKIKSVSLGSIFAIIRDQFKKHLGDVIITMYEEKLNDFLSYLDELEDDLKRRLPENEYDLRDKVDKYVEIANKERMKYIKELEDEIYTYITEEFDLEEFLMNVIDILEKSNRYFYKKISNVFGDPVTANGKLYRVNKKGILDLYMDNIVIDYENIVSSIIDMFDDETNEEVKNRFFFS